MHMRVNEMKLLHESYNCSHCYRKYFSLKYLQEQLLTQNILQAAVNVEVALESHELENV